MKKRNVCVIIMFFLILSGVFAAPSIIWKWTAADDEIRFFRYQFGAEDPEGWTVVDSDVTEYVLLDADPSMTYTLYVQQSYDGKVWSDSTRAEAATYPNFENTTYPYFDVVREFFDNLGSAGENESLSSSRIVPTSVGDIAVTVKEKNTEISYPEGYDDYAILFLRELEEKYPAYAEVVAVDIGNGMIRAAYDISPASQTDLDYLADALVSEIYSYLDSFVVAQEPVSPEEQIEGESESIEEVLPEDETGKYDDESIHSASSEPVIQNTEPEEINSPAEHDRRFSIRMDIGYGTQVSESSVKASSVVINPYKHNYTATLGFGYQVAEKLRLSASAGFGFTDFMVGTESRYVFTVPLLAGFELTLPEYKGVGIYIGGYAGWYLRYWDYHMAKSGPIVQLRVGLDVKLSSNLALTLSYGTSWILERWQDSSSWGISSQVYLEPISIGMRYIF